MILISVGLKKFQFTPYRKINTGRKTRRKQPNGKNKSKKNATGRIPVINYYSTCFLVLYFFFNVKKKHWKCFILNMHLFLNFS